MVESGMMGHPTKSKESMKVYPRLRLEHEYFQEAKKHEVGKTYRITLEVKMTGLSISKFQNDSEYEIHGYELGDDEKEE